MYNDSMEEGQKPKISKPLILGGIALVLVFGAYQSFVLIKSRVAINLPRSAAEENKAVADNKPAQDKSVSSVLGRLSEASDKILIPAGTSGARSIISDDKGNTQLHDYSLASELTQIGVDFTSNELDELSRGEKINLILQFKEKPVLEVKKDLQKKYGPKDVLAVNSELSKYRTGLRTSNTASINSVKRAAPEAVFKNSYISTFNGASLSISKKEIRKLSKSLFRKAYLNREVKTTLSDSVSLIEADKLHAQGIRGD